MTGYEKHLACDAVQMPNLRNDGESFSVACAEVRSQTSCTVGA